MGNDRQLEGSGDVPRPRRRGSIVASAEAPPRSQLLRVGTARAGKMAAGGHWAANVERGEAGYAYAEPGRAAGEHAVVHSTARAGADGPLSGRRPQAVAPSGFQGPGLNVWKTTPLVLSMSVSDSVESTENSFWCAVIAAALLQLSVSRPGSNPASCRSLPRSLSPRAARREHRHPFG